MTKCEECLDTGWVGDNGPGRRGNNEYMPCDCAKGKAIEAAIRNRRIGQEATADLIAELERRRPQNRQEANMEGKDMAEVRDAMARDAEERDAAERAEAKELED